MNFHVVICKVGLNIPVCFYYYSSSSLSSSCKKLTPFLASGLEQQTPSKVFQLSALGTLLYFCETVVVALFISTFVMLYLVLSKIVPLFWVCSLFCFWVHSVFCFHWFTLLMLASSFTMVSNCACDNSSVPAVSMAFCKVRSEPSWRSKSLVD